VVGDPERWQGVDAERLMHGLSGDSAGQTIASLVGFRLVERPEAFYIGLMIPVDRLAPGGATTDAEEALCIGEGAYIKSISRIERTTSIGFATP
jgi:hypothetical protein